MRPSKHGVTLSAIICVIAGFVLSSPATRLSAAPEFVLQFDGVDDRVTFGAAPELGASTFTLELWFKRTGAGVTTATGTGGLQTAIPLLTKGMAESEVSNLNMNYFLGIDGPRRVLVADFEDTATGLNHPVQGRTAICNDIWYHAAATYNGTTWRLYLNGELEATLLVGAFTPQLNSIQHAAIGTALGSLGAIPAGQTRGAFKGQIDEARIWNVARSQSAIQDTMDEALFAPQANLIGRWGFDEGSGTVAANTAGLPSGTLAPGVPQTPPTWITGGSGFATTLVPGADVLRLTGTNVAGDYVTFGSATSTLGVTTFTIETWFNRSGPGVGTTTGSDGLVGAIPLVTKGRAEAENSNVDMNYFLGIDATNVLAADFEDAPNGPTAGGPNHVIRGVTPLPAGWNHAAVTYDGRNLQLYLNGVADGPPVFVGKQPRADSIQHAAIGTALNSTGLPVGFFAGAIDETRIWSHARSASQIAATASREIPSANGLLARWSFNDCCGRVVDSTGHLSFGPPPAVVPPGNAIVGGTLFGSGWSWAPRGDSTLSTTVNLAPSVDAGADQTVMLPASGVLAGSVSDDGVNTGSPLSSAWSMTSGPGTVIFGDPASPSTSVSFSVTGTYVLALAATDGELSGADSVTIVVNGVVNLAPVVAAGGDQAITLPIDTVALSGTVSDDGLPAPAVLALWSKVSGPGTVTFANATMASTSATFSADGTYVLQLMATDSLLSAGDTLSVVVEADAANSAFKFGGTNAYVTFGGAPQLGASTFTLEAWIRREGTGIATFTGVSGVTAVPLVTKGMAEADGTAQDMNYFLGIIPGSGVLAADFEDTATGLNHPITGSTAIPPDGRWHHVAASYDGTTWRLYFDGTQDAMLAVGAFTPRADSLQHAAIGTALNSLGVVTAGQTAGFFHGAMDEVRIWNYARSAAQILHATNREIPSASGLLGRWGLNEGIGTVVGDSTASAVTGTIVGTNYSWVGGAHVTGAPNAPPVAEAGADHTVTLPGLGTVSGSVTDDGLTGVPITTQWSQVSGPGATVFGDPSAAVTTVDVSALGTYVLRLTANDGELTGSDDVTILVDGVINRAPTVDAGADATLTLPDHVASLSGTVNDDGLPSASVTTQWTTVSGPAPVAFVGASALATTATFSQHGTYVLRLSASDGVLSGSDTVTVTVDPDPANKALQFGGTNAVVTFGAAPGLGAATFTIETWFRRDGAGVPTSTGTGGTTAIPLLSKGMAEVDLINNRDMNYFLGIRQSDGVLVADFEDTATAGNHPVAGATPIAVGPAWHHAAATYDGSTWRLYLDGQLERTLFVGATPRADSIQHAALGTALNSVGTAGSQTQGFFHGALDEARVWSYARSPQQISRGRLLEIATQAPGLLGRWGLNEGSGSLATNSAAAGIHGAITGTAWSWTAGAPFTGANLDPAAADDTATTPEDAPVTMAVLGNDTDADGDTLAIAPVGIAAHGTVVANADGTLTYTPAGDYHGPDSFTYGISDGLGGSASATVSLTVTPVNDAPVAADDAATTAEDTPVVIPVLANDTDAEGDTLTPAVVTAPANGTVTVAADGSVAYTPAANYNGTDSFTYQVNDGSADSGVVTVSITISAVNDAPVAAGDSYSLDEDGTLQVDAPGVLGNDADADGDSLSVMILDGPSHGSLTLNADGGLVYTPNANYHGDDTFTYRATDGQAESADALVTIAINAVNDAPSAMDDSYSTDEDMPLVVGPAGVLGNDTDPDGNSLQAMLVSGPSHGTLALNADGSFTYTPAANYHGPDSFSYKNSDGPAESSVANVTITVTEVNDAPVASDETFSTNEDSALTVSAPGVLANDSDAEGSSLSAVVVAGPSHGTLTPNADGSFSYTPAADFHGTDTFSYKANDGAELSSVATVTITVIAVNDAPAAADDNFSATEDAALSAAAPGVLANDNDVEGDSLSATLASSTSHGSLTFNADGSFGYTPAGNYSGTDSFTYTVSDGTAASEVVTVTITVTGVNDVPVASADSFSTSEDIALVVAAPGVTANDSDADSDSLAAVLVSGPTHGTLALNSDGSFSYTPAADYNGPDSFTYQANDGAVDSNVVTVTIDVTAVSDAPVAADNSYSKKEDISLEVAAPGVLGNDRHGDGLPFSAMLTSGTSHGTVGLNWDGSFTYTPEANFNGTDSFTYQAHDGTLTSDTATVTITVRAVNDPPEATHEEYSTNEDTPLSIAGPGVLANDTDIDSATLTAVRVSGPGHGTLALNANGGFTYTPAPNYNGPDTFVYRVRDGDGGSDLATVTLMVNAVEDAPVANDQPKTLNEDSLKTVTLTATDAEGSPLTFTIVTPPTHGVLTGTLPALKYDPDPNYNGSDSFSFTANDGGMDSNIATVSFTVNPVNDAPVAQAANYTTPINTSLSGQLGATDVERDPLTYGVTQLPTKGSVDVNPATGAFTYAPFPGKTGTDVFKFKASDGPASSNAARIEIRIQ